MTEPVPLCKGSALIDLVKTARKNRPAFDKHLPPATRILIDSRILPLSWYPEVHHESLLIAAAGILGKGDLGFCRTIGKIGIRRTNERIYKASVVPGDVVATLALFPVYWARLHNTGAATVDLAAPGVIRVTISDYGHPNLATCICIAGWIEGKVELAGGRSEVTEDKCRTRGDAACVYSVHLSDRAGTSPG